MSPHKRGPARSSSSGALRHLSPRPSSRVTHRRIPCDNAYFVHDPTRLPAAGFNRFGWLLPVFVAVYLIVCTWSQRLALPGNPRFPFLLILISAAGVAAAAARRIRVEPLLVAVVLVCAASLLTDFIYFFHIHFTDLGIYLAAGRHFLDGQPVYQANPMTAMPKDAAQLPFLYPPPTVPFFAVLAALPFSLGAILFVIGSVAVVLVAIRRLGLSLPWSLLVLAWPPLFDGIMSGNVSVPLFAVFVLAPWCGTGLVVSPLLKSYNVIAALWLVRERRFRAIAVGGAIVAALCIVTLPMVGGLRAWYDWITGLSTFAQSAANVQTLYGLGLARYLPTLVALVIGAALVSIALLVRGREALARLGIATLALQPSVYAHGYIVSLPALLSLRSAWFWAAAAPLSITITTGPSISRGAGWPGAWISIVIVIASWVVPALRRDATCADEPYHPLGHNLEAWPSAPTTSRF
jgi:hypothetical protein